MGRVQNTRSGHVQKAVLPFAAQLLLSEAANVSQIKPLSEVAEIEMGQSPAGDSCNSEGKGMLLLGGPSDLGTVYPKPSKWTNSPTKKCKNGDILVCVRATIGEPRWSDGEYCLGRGLAAIRPKNREVKSSFLFHVIEGNQKLLQECGTGTTFKTISKKHLEAVEVPMLPPKQQESIGKFLQWLASHDEMVADWSSAPALPSTFTKQCRIVAKIESLAAKIDEANQLREEIKSDMDALLVSMAHRNDLSDKEKISKGWKHIPLGEVLTQVSDPVEVQPGEEYPHFGIYGFARGLFKKAPLSGDEIKASTLYRVKEGQFIYSRLKAFEGAFGSVSSDFNGRHVSNEFPTFELDQDRVNNEFLVAYLKSLTTWKELAVHSKGVGARRERLKPVDFLAHEVWLPPFKWQHKIKETSERLEEIKEDRDSVGRNLEALLPAILDKAFRGEL